MLQDTTAVENAERERDRERERERQTDRDRQTETETDRDRKTETDRGTETELKIERQRETDRKNMSFNISWRNAIAHIKLGFFHQQKTKLTVHNVSKIMMKCFT